MRKIAGREIRRPAVGDAAPQTRRRKVVRQVHRGDREKFSKGHRARRSDGAGGPVDRRNRKSLCAGRQRRIRRRFDASPFRILPDLAPGKARRCLCGRGRERSDERSPRAAAQGALRRDLLRRSAHA